MSESNKIEIPVISFDEDGKSYFGSVLVDTDTYGDSPSVIINISDIPKPLHKQGKDVLDNCIGLASGILGTFKNSLPGGATFSIMTTPINIAYDYKYGEESFAQALTSQGIAGAAGIVVGALATIALAPLIGGTLAGAAVVSAISVLVASLVSEGVNEKIDEHWADLENIVKKATTHYPNGDPYGYMIPHEFTTYLSWF
jgi:hypothetical protein